jgi:hypothetical protein
VLKTGIIPEKDRFATVTSSKDEPISRRKLRVY